MSINKQNRASLARANRANYIFWKQRFHRFINCKIRHAPTKIHRTSSRSRPLDNNVKSDLPFPLLSQHKHPFETTACFLNNSISHNASEPFPIKKKKSLFSAQLQIFDWMRTSVLNLVPLVLFVLQLLIDGTDVNMAMLPWFYWLKRLKRGVDHANRPSYSRSDFKGKRCTREWRRLLRNTQKTKHFFNHFCFHA